jgi:type I restriction enzyme S subunit
MLREAMPRYEAYKDSGVEWLGEIPAHWEEKRLKFVFEMRVSNVDKNIINLEKPVKLCNYVDVYKNNYITESISFMEVTATAEEIERFRIRKGDVLITKDSEDWSDIGVPALVKHEEPYLLCGYHLAILRADSQVAGAFLFWALLAQYNRTQFSVKANGVTRYGISHGSIKNIWLVLPPINEQTTISAFLDRKTAKIDQAIAIKEKQISLLKERKQILIQNAVTRGLDPDAAMRDSGVEWIGEIPAHWDIQPIKFSLKGIVDCEHKTAPFVEASEYLVVRTSNVKEGQLQFNEAKYTNQNGYKNWTRRGIPEPGDVLFTREAPAGEACLVPNNQKICLGQRMVWLKVDRSKIIPEFIIYLIYSKLVRTYIDFLSAGSTVLHFNMSDINNIPIMSVPLEEQTAIVTHIQTQTTKIDKAIALQQQQIEKLKEYKATLINSAVTGKIKVPSNSNANKKGGL